MQGFSGFASLPLPEGISVSEDPELGLQLAERPTASLEPGMPCPAPALPCPAPALPCPALHCPLLAPRTLKLHYGIVQNCPRITGVRPC